MSASNIITATVDLARGVQLHRLGRLFASGDKAAHTISVTVLQDGAAADLSGQTVKGYFIRADDATVTFDGTLSGNVASVTLPNSCYAVAGHFQIIVKALSTNVNTAIFYGDGAVTRSSTDIIVDPDHIVPSLEELLAMLDDMEAAAEAANDAADAADTAAGSANSAATSATTAAASATTAASAASAAAQQVTDAIIPDLSDVTTNTIAAGQNASVVIDTDDEGTPHNPKVTFNIPRGADGAGSIETVDGISPINGNVALPVMQGTNGSAAGAAGKVPAPATTDAGKFLKANGTWAMPPTYVGADQSDPGVPGLVPSAPSADRLKFLRGDGTWVAAGGGGGGASAAYIGATITVNDWEMIFDVELSKNYGYSVTVAGELAGGYFIPQFVSGRENLMDDIYCKIDSSKIIFATNKVPAGTIQIYGYMLSPGTEYGSVKTYLCIRKEKTALNLTIATSAWQTGQSWPGGSAPLGESSLTCDLATITSGTGVASCVDGDDVKVSEYSQSLCSAPLWVYIGNGTVYVATRDNCAPSDSVTIRGLILHQ